MAGGTTYKISYFQKSIIDKGIGTLCTSSLLPMIILKSYFKIKHPNISEKENKPGTKPWNQGFRSPSNTIPSEERKLLPTT